MMTKEEKSKTMTTRHTTVQQEATQIKEIMDDKCLMELVEAEGMTPQQWLKVETERHQHRADAYCMTLGEYTSQFWTGEDEDWS